MWLLAWETHSRSEPPRPCTWWALPWADFNSPCAQELHLTVFIYKPRQKSEKNKYITKKITWNPSLFAYSVYTSLAQALQLHIKICTIGSTQGDRQKGAAVDQSQLSCTSPQAAAETYMCNSKMLLEAQPHSFAELWEISVQLQLRHRRSASTTGWQQKSKPLLSAHWHKPAASFSPQFAQRPTEDKSTRAVSQSETPVASLPHSSSPAFHRGIYFSHCYISSTFDMQVF